MNYEDDMNEKNYEFFIGTTQKLIKHLNWISN